MPGGQYNNGDAMKRWAKKGVGGGMIEEEEEGRP